MSVQDNYKYWKSQVERAAKDAGRDAGDVLLLAVSKTVGPLGVAAAMDAGARAFGENRPEQLVEKSELFGGAQWHFIGNIQSRRIREIVAHAALIHSVYKSDHLPKIDAAARDAGKVQRILVEVNVSGEASKSGLAPADVPDFVARAAAYPNIAVCGLMTMAPAGDAAAADATFKGLKALFDEVKKTLGEGEREQFCELSAGMSDDWQQAIAHGSTIVRLGRAIFSDSYPQS